MDREKQIDNLDTKLRNIFGSSIAYKINYNKFGGYDGHSEVFTTDIAKYLYNAGYRQQSEVAREIFEEIFHIIRDYEFDALSVENSYGIFQVRNMGAEILKLKKKYTEESGNDR